jgi:hypothetical protein
MPNPIQQVIEILSIERDKLDRAIALLQGMGSAEVTGPAHKPGKSGSKMTQQQRRNFEEGMREMLATRSDPAQAPNQKPRKSARSWTPARRKKFQSTMRAKAAKQKSGA